MSVSLKTMVPFCNNPVTEYYQEIRTKLTTNFRETAKSWCKSAKVPERFCEVPVQARTEFTPRYDPARTSIRSIIKATRSVFNQRPSAYDPPDVFNPNLHAPEGSIDVLAIAESGIPFTSNFGRIRRRDSLLPADSQPQTGASSVNPEIAPGKGWVLSSSVGTDMCDGEYDSWCGRAASGTCLLYAHNDNRGGLVFDGLSGWGIFELPNLKEGLIAIKTHDWFPAGSDAATAGWTTIDNEVSSEGRALDENENRELKKKPKPYCDDFKFEFAIDGKITVWNKDEWLEHAVNTQRVVQLATLLDDPNYTGGAAKTVELAIRITGCQRDKTFSLTHVYWA